MASTASAERRLLESVCDAARSEGGLTREQWGRLRAAFGERFERAWRLVEERRIKRYTFEPSGRRAWIAVGRDREYQLLPASGYCGCNDFYFRVVDEGGGLCYHLIAQRLAEALAAADDVREGDDVYGALVSEWRRQSFDDR